ncbi:sialate O-acetylesterase [Acinetobacter pittii]|uniref:sialate O-acetylesterase n=1 Tax=Acinetobacter pittii TaxID=48296 RepID=UPI001EFCA476|nr:sialate O-acetylesterase [Acinetobacter pittii]MCG9492675.1 sialate O-acetylesterase [Acinetobacter pittii]
MAVLTPEDFENFKRDMDDTGKALSTKSVIEPRYGEAFYSLPLAIQKVMEAGGYEPFPTETQLLASIPTVSPKAAKAMDTKKVWYWGKYSESETVDSWHDTGLSELDQAKLFAEGLSESDREFSTTGLNIQQEALKEILQMGIYDKDNPKIYPIAADSNNKVLLGFNTETGKIVAIGLDEKTNIKAFTDTSSMKAFFNDSKSLIPIITDDNYNIILGFDNSKGVLVGLFDSNELQNQTFDINQIVFYGQSLSRGGANEPGWISITQPYFNITFEGTAIPTGFGSFNPLVEGYNETPCSGCANGSVYLAYTENGINPADNVILASAAGVGGAHLRQLIKGTTAYTNMLQHVAAGHSLALAQGKTHGVTSIGWAQGEENLRLMLDLDVYSEMLPQTFRDMKADFRAITNQLSEIRVISYQLSTRIGLSEVVCKTQFDLAKRREIAISTPTYLFDYDDRDSVHFHPPSYKWMGAYYARAHKQWVVDGRFPDWLEPMGATILGKTITVSFDVPTAPLVFDTTLLAPTDDHGFAISDGTDLLAIQNITANDTTVTIELVDNPASIVGLKVRYGLDYLGTGKPIADGKSGNLRDSTPDTTLVQNIVKPLYHICPHFELDIINGAI